MSVQIKLIFLQVQRLVSQSVLQLQNIDLSKSSGAGGSFVIFALYLLLLSSKP